MEESIERSRIQIIAGVSSNNRAIAEGALGQGHQVRLIPAQFVKPHRKSNKNDFIDAAAIGEAVTKQNMRFVQIKRRSNWVGRPCTACAADWCSAAPR